MRRASAVLLAAAATTGLTAAPAWAEATPAATEAGPGGTGAAECSGSSPVACHVEAAPGTYQVTAVLGGESAGATTVAAESRRALLETAETAAGERVTVRFSVDVRDPQGEPQGPRGTPGLDLTFGGEAPRIDQLDVVAGPSPQLLIAGDSTACDQASAPYTGWGQRLPRFFDQGLSVANHADSGEGSGSFLAAPELFASLRSHIQPGDVVLIQFAHNDKRTSAADYRAHLAELIDGVRAQDGQPVLVTPIVRRWFNDDGTLDNATALHVNGLGVDLPAQMRQLAADEDVPLIDLTARSKARVEELGPADSSALYLVDEAGDSTHTSQRGADEYAAEVLDELRDQGLVPTEVIR